MCALTHSVDPSVFHFLAALWFIQSWGAEVTQWLAAFAKPRKKKESPFSNLAHATTTGPLGVFNSLFRCVVRFVFAWVSVCVTKELAQSGDTRHKAVEGHVQLARSEALGEQLHYLAVALHPCRKRKCGVRRACVHFVAVCVCARMCVHSINTDSFQRWAELKGAHRSRGVLVKLKEDGLKGKIAPKKLTIVFTFRVIIILFTHKHRPPSTCRLRKLDSRVSACFRLRLERPLDCRQS